MLLALDVIESRSETSKLFAGHLMQAIEIDQVRLGSYLELDFTNFAQKTIKLDLLRDSGTAVNGKIEIGLGRLLEGINGIRQYLVWGSDRVCRIWFPILFSPP